MQEWYLKISLLHQERFEHPDVNSKCCGGSRTKLETPHLLMCRCQPASVWQACVMSEKPVAGRQQGGVEEADKGLIDMEVCCVWQWRRVAFLASNRSGRRQRSCLFAWSSNSICLFCGRKGESDTLPFVSSDDRLSIMVASTNASQCGNIVSLFMLINGSYIRPHTET